MEMKLSEIATIVGGEVVGDGDLIIKGLSGIKEAKEGELTFLANSKYNSLASSTKASALIIPRDVEVQNKSVIKADNASLAFANIVSHVIGEDTYRLKGIHPTAVIGKNVSLGKDVAIGPYAIIEDDAVIGDSSIIYGTVYVGNRTVLGQGCVLYPHVTIRERCVIGERVIIHSGSVVGADGFGFEQVEGVHQKIAQIGIVEIGDDVEIGANVTIDRARFDKTVVGKGSKIDNLVQIGHNVVIGEHCTIVSQVGIAGSVNIEDGVILAGQAGVTGHLTIGAGSVVAAQSAVTKTIPAGSKVSGFPAKPHDHAKKVNAAFQRLPIYVKTIRRLEQKIAELEAKIDKDNG